jgi:hypothetical protein
MSQVSWQEPALEEARNSEVTSSGNIICSPHHHLEHWRLRGREFQEKKLTIRLSPSSTMFGCMIIFIL